MIRARISRALYHSALWLYGIRPMPLTRPATYRDPAPPVEVASPPPPKRPRNNSSLGLSIFHASFAGIALSHENAFGLSVNALLGGVWLWAWWRS